MLMEAMLHATFCVARSAWEPPFDRPDPRLPKWRHTSWRRPEASRGHIVGPTSCPARRTRGGLRVQALPPPRKASPNDACPSPSDAVISTNFGCRLQRGKGRAAGTIAVMPSSLDTGRQPGPREHARARSSGEVIRPAVPGAGGSVDRSAPPAPPPPALSAPPRADAARPAIGREPRQPARASPDRLPGRPRARTGRQGVPS